MISEQEEMLKRLEELVVSQARLSFDERLVAVRRDDLREVVRLARKALGALPVEEEEGRGTPDAPK